MAKKTAKIADFEVSSSTGFMKPGQMSESFLDGDVTDLDAADDDDLELGQDPSSIAGDEHEEEGEESDELEDGLPAPPKKTAKPAAAEADEDEEASDEDGEDADEEFSFAPMVHDLLEEGVLVLPEGKTIADYDDDEEGFREVITDSAREVLYNTVAELPATARRIVELALNGGNEDDLQQLLVLEDGPDWQAVDLSEEDVQKAVVEEAMRLRDPELTDEEIADSLADLEDLGKLAKQAAKDQKYLVKHQEGQKAQIEAQVAEREAAAEEAYKKEVATVRNYITEVKEIAGLSLTKADRDGFMAYLTVKGKDGKTQADHMNTAERRIQKEFLNYKNFNLGKLKAEARTEATKEIKKQLGRYNAGRTTSNQGQRPVKRTDGLDGAVVSPSAWLAGFSAE
jgi:hypothetical protein